VGGALSGRRFASKIGDGTRPTSDRVREAIASAVASRGGFEGTRVLDLFAGTGAMAIEALSRGAAKVIEESLRTLGLSDRATVLTLDLSQRSAAARIEGPFDRVFIDPPYAEAGAVAPLLDALAPQLADDALIVLEHPSKLDVVLGPMFGELVKKRYGDSAVLFARYARPEGLPS
jgi:16S rRNA (guanine966-N2)-methyltransferase